MTFLIPGLTKMSRHQGQGQRPGRQSRAPEAADRLLIVLQIGAHHAEVGGKEVYGTGHGPEARTGVRYQSLKTGQDRTRKEMVRPRGIIPY